jgi:hypothetical protein
MRRSVYIETTVVSYLTARPTNDVVMRGHQVLTQGWWANDRPAFDLCTSELVLTEAGRGDPVAAAQRLAAIAGIRQLPITETAIDLANSIAVAISLPVRAQADALHAAVAAVHGIEFLLTWNCRHLANGLFAPTIERTCSAAGFTPLASSHPNR